MKKLVVILGPTASGKTEFAIHLAKKFQGEIISADSRQVYKSLDIGTGKITKKEMQGVPHHLLDVASPKRRFTVAHYQKKTRKAIQDIQKKDKLPFLVGGSPLYIYAVVDGWIIPEVPPNLKLRRKLEKLSVDKLLKRLQKLDPKRAKTIEQKNRRRLIRALEIILSTGKPVPQLKKHPLPYSVLFIGTKKSSQQLQQNIKNRFLMMLKHGFLNEIKELRKQGLSWKRIESFGLEYREGTQHLQSKISRNEMVEQVAKATVDFARRQMTWFKKDQRIHWIKNQREAENLISLSF
tara:strand:+ start:2014 stop:2895 length:882 start_codon:yes stop_codon:yes gene_type:complete